MPQSPPPPPPSKQTFTTEANRFLHDLSIQHASHLSEGNDTAVLHSARAASIIRRATLVYNAASDILPAVALRQSPHLARATTYLRGIVARLWNALRSRDLLALETGADAAQAVLDSFQEGEWGLFERIDPNTLALDEDHPPKRPVIVAGNTPSDDIPSDVWSSPDDPSPIEQDSDGKPNGDISPVPPEAEQRAAAKKRRRKKLACCGLSFSDLGPRDKLILWLYFFMILGAFIAVTAVTVDFVRQQINPGSFIRSEVADSLPAPVVTVCLSQRGVPASRLQLFNFTNAEGFNVRGPEPRAPHGELLTPEYAEAVERFWDNPDNEDCDKKVGDYYPFPLQSLINLTLGITTTKCRPCYRVGRKTRAISRSTDFQDSSVLEFYTDNYFLQCMKNPSGLDDDSLAFLHEQVNEKKKKMVEVGVLTAENGVNVEDLDLEQFKEITAEQCCNLFYFGFFPRVLEKDAGDVDMQFVWNGTEWEERGEGPFFRLKKAEDILPEESLQMFVGTNESTVENEIGKGRDMILIGPNTQTFATFRPVIVYGKDRYDISSSTSNLLTDNVTAIFGYWLKYRIYYNFNRFVTDEWYQESTYPVSQWIVDLTGYASLFTGASLFSLLLLPLLRAMRKREKQRLIRQQPEAYLWAKHKLRYKSTGAAHAGAGVSSANLEDRDNDGLIRGRSVMLPGFNV